MQNIGCTSQGGLISYTGLLFVILSSMCHSSYVKPQGCSVHHHASCITTHLFPLCSPPPHMVCIHVTYAASSAYKYLAGMEERPCHIEVIEYCDLGNMSTALKYSVFQVRGGGST